MKTARMEAFSDGVLAIIITIMVLELKAPHGTEIGDLGPLWPTIVSYVLSFIYIGIYWNNHHHLLHATREVSGPVLWANLHLLFWLSLVPFCTAWMGENHFAAVPTALYGVPLLGAAIAYWLLQRTILRAGHNEMLARALGSDFKGKISPVLYVAAIPSALLWHPAIGGALYGAVALMWLIPDRRIEKELNKKR